MDQTRKEPPDATDNSTREPVPVWLVVVTSIADASGIYFRFAHLDFKTCWRDEAWTLAHVSGSRVLPLADELSRLGVVHASKLQEAQELRPYTNVTTTIGIIAADDAQHPPIYYAVVRLWAQAVGASTLANARLMAAAFGVLALPFTYWLSLELFDRRRDVALVVVALLSLSPLHILYAQEAREYSLWATTILCSSAMLLFAMRVDRWWAWIGYGLSAVLGLYTSMLFSTVLLAHGLFVVAITWLDFRTRGRHLPHRMVWFCVIGLIAVATFLPWVSLALSGRGPTVLASGWLAQQVTAREFLKRGLVNATALFIDLNAMQRPTLLDVLVIAVMGIAAIWAWMKMGFSARSFLIPLAIVPVLPHLVPDLMRGGARTLQPRYLLPMYASVLLAVGFAITCLRGTGARHVAFPIALMACLVAGFTSSVLSWRADWWWTKAGARDFRSIAQLIEKEPRPLLVVDLYSFRFTNLLSVCHYLDPHTEILLLPDKRDLGAWRPPRGYSAIYLAHDNGRRPLMAGDTLNDATEPIAGLQSLRIFRTPSK